MYTINAGYCHSLSSTQLRLRWDAQHDLQWGAVVVSIYYCVWSALGLRWLSFLEVCNWFAHDGWRFAGDASAIGEGVLDLSHALPLLCFLLLLYNFLLVIVYIALCTSTAMSQIACASSIQSLFMIVCLSLHMHKSCLCIYLGFCFLVAITMICLC